LQPLLVLIWKPLALSLFPTSLPYNTAVLRIHHVNSRSKTYLLLNLTGFRWRTSVETLCCGSRFRSTSPAGIIGPGNDTNLKPIVIADVQASNGVIHALSRVIIKNLLFL